MGLRSRGSVSKIFSWNLVEVPRSVSEAFQYMKNSHGTWRLEEPAFERSDAIARQIPADSDYHRVPTLPAGRGRSCGTFRAGFLRGSFTGPFFFFFKFFVGSGGF